MTVEFQGVSYTVPEAEPLQSRDPTLLHPLFKDALERYVVFAQNFTAYEVRIGECRRTLERQVYLYALGRVLPGPVRSWTLDSKHRYGLAADLILVDKGADLELTVDDTAVWTDHVWLDLYRAAPPTWFSLTPISKERVHLEAIHAAQLIDRAEELQLVLT